MHTGSYWWNAFLVLTMLGSGVTSGILGMIAIVDGNHHHHKLALSTGEWLFSYGVAVVIFLLLAAADMWAGDSPEKKAARKTDGASWLTGAWNLLEFFIVVPWLIVGQVLLLHGVGHHSPSSLEYGVMIWAVASSYLLGTSAFFARTGGAKHWTQEVEYV